MTRALRAALAALVFAAACGPAAAPPRAPSNTPAAAADAPVVEPDGVVVIDAGAAPRRALRYQIAAGTTRHARYHARTAVAGAAPVDIDLTWTYGFDRAGDDAVVTLTLGPSALPVPAGATGSWRLGPGGRHAAAPPDNAGRVILQQTQAEHMLPVVPAAAVGVGARWTAPMAISGGLGEEPMAGLATWTLVTRTATTAVARATIDVPATAMSAGDAALTMRGHGTVDAQVDLAAYTATATMHLAFVVDRGDGADAPMADIAIDLTIE